MKTYELRKDDRRYAVDDELELVEWDPDKQEFTGRVERKRVTYVQHGMNNVGVVEALRGLSAGYVILALGDSK